MEHGVAGDEAGGQELCVAHVADIFDVCAQAEPHGDQEDERLDDHPADFNLPSPQEGVAVTLPHVVTAPEDAAPEHHC